MLYNNFSEELLGLQDAIATKIEETEENLTIHIQLKQRPHHCICCGTATDTIHDYRNQIIKDISAFGRKTIIVLRKRRYRCPHCGKRFMEENSSCLNTTE